MGKYEPLRLRYRTWYSGLLLLLSFNGVEYLVSVKHDDSDDDV